MADRDDEFLRRWSRRKLESREKLPGTTEVADEDRLAPGMPGEAEEREKNIQAARLSEEPEDASIIRPGPEEELTEEDFKHVDFDALNYESDYQQFMSKGVPEAIQRKALRKLWQSNPILANIDGLNDYDEDFTDAALAVDVIKTAYKVGRGYLSDEELEEMAKIGRPEEVEGVPDDDVAAADKKTVETAALEDEPELSADEVPQDKRDELSGDTSEGDQKEDSRSDGGKATGNA